MLNTQGPNPGINAEPTAKEKERERAILASVRKDPDLSPGYNNIGLMITSVPASIAFAGVFAYFAFTVFMEMRRCYLDNTKRDENLSKDIQ